ncbi:hypothetical protein PMI12_02377 [Variovorax sp. CF313]|nr:hypothetical protein PMI12_02377 [Variovorax sp. CF313]
MNVRQFYCARPGKSSRCHRLHLGAERRQGRTTGGNSHSSRRSSARRKGGWHARFQMALQIRFSRIQPGRKINRSGNAGLAERLRASGLCRAQSPSKLLDCRRASATKRWCRYSHRPCHGRFAKRQICEYCASWLAKNLGSIPQFMELEARLGQTGRRKADAGCTTCQARSLHCGVGITRVPGCSAYRCTDHAGARRSLVGGRGACRCPDRPSISSRCPDQGRAARRRLHYENRCRLHQSPVAAWRQAAAPSGSPAR